MRGGHAASACARAGPNRVDPRWVPLWKHIVLYIPKRNPPPVQASDQLAGSLPNESPHVLGLIQGHCDRHVAASGSTSENPSSKRCSQTPPRGDRNEPESGPAHEASHLEGSPQTGHSPGRPYCCRHRAVKHQPPQNAHPELRRLIISRGGPMAQGLLPA